MDLDYIVVRLNKSAYRYIVICACTATQLSTSQLSAYWPVNKKNTIKA